MKALTVVLVGVVCLFVGWIAGGDGVANAQTPPTTTLPIETPPPDCHYEIPFEARLDGHPVLLNQCTGDTWRFDDGWDTAQATYVRPYTWQRIQKGD